MSSRGKIVSYPSAASRIFAIAVLCTFWGTVIFSALSAGAQPSHSARQLAVVLCMGLYALSRKYNVEAVTREPRNEREQTLVERLVIIKRIGIFATLASVVWIFLVMPTSIAELMLPLLLFVTGSLLQLISAMLYRPFITLKQVS